MGEGGKPVNIVERIPEFPWLEPARAQGWLVEPVTSFHQLIEFARAFARRNYDARALRQAA